MSILSDKIHREITPLKNNDCFLVFDRRRKAFNFPIHFHPEYELNYISNAKGAKRIIGDNIAEIDQKELVLTGPNLFHGWENHNNCRENEYHEITIQFSHDVFGETLLNKNLLSSIKAMLRNANRGSSFRWQL